jgi:dihydropteroate synthase
LDLRAQGADILDVGGESTRPGATRPLVEEELGRVIPVITGLVAQGCVVSIDTMRAEVAQAALSAGASIVNDVSGGLADPDILGVVAASRARYVAMHWRAHSTTMQQHASYSDVVAEVVDELSARVSAALEAGIAPERLSLDPGLGFAKTPEHNWTLLRHLDAFESLGLPLLVGASRKSFLGALLQDANGVRPTDQRIYADTAIVTLLGMREVWAVRVHDVRAAADALAVTRAWKGEVNG